MDVTLLSSSSLHGEPSVMLVMVEPSVPSMGAGRETTCGWVHQLLFLLVAAQGVRVPHLQHLRGGGGCRGLEGMCSRVHEASK